MLLSAATVIPNVAHSAERTPTLLEVSELEVFLVEEPSARLRKRQRDVGHHIFVQLDPGTASARRGAKYIVSLQPSQTLRCYHYRCVFVRILQAEDGRGERGGADGGAGGVSWLDVCVGNRLIGEWGGGGEADGEFPRMFQVHQVQVIGCSTVGRLAVID